MIDLADHARVIDERNEMGKENARLQRDLAEAEIARYVLAKGA